MAVADVFKVYLFPDPLVGAQYNDEGFEDITSGILNVQITSGSEIYEGPSQQIDTGQFTIVSRNPNLDPKVNPNIRYNARIAFCDNRLNSFEPQVFEFYRGYITSINVEYQRNDNPIITISGTDIFGLLQRTVVNETLFNEIIDQSTGPTWDGISFEEFVSQNEFFNLFSSKYYTDEMMQNTWIPSGGGQIGPGVGTVPFRFNTVQLSQNASFPDQVVEGLMGWQPAKYIPQVGETFLEVINKYASTNLNYLTPRDVNFGFDFINVYPFAKYDAQYWNFIEDPYLSFLNYDFSSNPSDNKSYESINLSNGFDRVINQIEVSNEYTTLDGTNVVSNKENFSYLYSDSVDNYAVSKLNISTVFPESSDVSISSLTNRMAQSIFQFVANPSDEIEQITFDNARYQDIQNEFGRSFYEINQTIRIKHEDDNIETIDRLYDIGGITHNISPDKWETTFNLKPAVAEIVFQYQGQRPTIQMNSKTGDTNFNFTATITDYPIEDILSVLWCLNAPEASESFPGGKNQGPYYYASTLNGERYVDSISPFGLTQTWNFDDDNLILRPYESVEPILNIFGGIGPGYWTVYAYIVLKSGFTVIGETELIVGTPAVQADFVWSQNITNNFGQVQFTDTSVNNETGEANSYAWDFGDGTTSAEQNPIHLYNPGPGDTEYDVSLTVFAYGSGGVVVPSTHTETVTLEQPIMVPDFTWVANAQIVTFTNTSTNVGFEEPDAYLWEFDDGTTSTLKNPVHTFPVADENVEESFSVKLTTRNIWEQTESVTKTVTTTALNKSGTFPVRYIKFSIDPYTRPGDPGIGERFAISPVMSVLKATTSGTGANLTYLKPLTGFQDAYLPTVGYNATGGGSVQVANGQEFFLTRDIQTDPAYYGIGPIARAGLIDDEWKTVRWELVVDLGATTQLIDDINLRFEDLAVALGGVLTLYVESFYARINIEFATTVGGTTPNAPGIYGPPSLNGNWVNVGYIKLDGGRMDPTKPGGQRTNKTESIFKMRPMPLNIPYFNYTFNDKIVSFTSVETADSYAWTFGDGTTSTLKDPVKTYASYGTYTVTLAVTNGGVVTRTTTEPVIVQALVI